MVCRGVLGNSLCAGHAGEQRGFACSGAAQHHDAPVMRQRLEGLPDGGSIFCQVLSLINLIAQIKRLLSPQADKSLLIQMRSSQLHVRSL